MEFHRITSLASKPCLVYEYHDQIDQLVPTWPELEYKVPVLCTTVLPQEVEEA